MTASHHRVAGGRTATSRSPEGGQRIWFAFAEVRHHWWQRLLRRGFRHCFAAIEDGAGWTVVEPLSGRLIVARLDVPAAFDLPGFYRRAGLVVSGPHVAENPRFGLAPSTLNCVSIGRALLGDAAPFSLTPAGFHKALENLIRSRKRNLTSGLNPG